MVAHVPSVALAVGFVLVMRWLLLRSGADATLTSNSLRDEINSAARLPIWGGM